MLDGGVKLVAKTDALIMEYTSKFLQRKGMQKKVYITDKVRELARFLTAVRKQDGMADKSLDDCVSTANVKKLRKQSGKACWQCQISYIQLCFNNSCCRQACRWF